jgi:pilus assembly protein Flp/PilA
MLNPIAVVRSFLTSEDGPTAVEYVVMLAMIIMACITVVRSFGAPIGGMFSSANGMFGAGS